MTQRDRPREGLLLALTVVAAGTDAVSYLGLGNVFPANMTGNTVLLGIGLATGSFARAGRSAVALAAFVAGAAAAGLLGGSVAWRSLVTRGLLGETALLAAACGWDLAVTGAPRHALIALVSIAMGLQSGVVLRLGVGVSTTYITGTWTAVSGWFADRLGRGTGDDCDDDCDGGGAQGARALVLGCYFGAALLAGGSFALAGRVAFGARLPAAGRFVQRLRNRRSLARLVALAEADPVQGELRST